MLPLFSYPPEGAISTGDWLRAPRFGVCFGWGRGCLASVPGTFVFVPPCSPGTTHPSSVTSCLSGVHRLPTLPLPLEEHSALLPGWKPEPAQPFVISCLWPWNFYSRKLGHRCSILYPLFSPPFTFQKWKVSTFPSCCNLNFTSFGVALASFLNHEGA